MDYIAPRKGLTAFNCPFCGAYAHQQWYKLYGEDEEVDSVETNLEATWSACCEKTAVWSKDKLVYPLASSAPLPSPDMPADVAVDFNEARDVLGVSPRSSAALLRLALQKLCKHMGQRGDNINADIGSLVSSGQISPKIQQALDYVRIVGNNAVHPGELDLRDDLATAHTLFAVLNLIITETITRPRELDELYKSLPEGARKAVEKRDAKKGATP